MGLAAILFKSEEPFEQIVNIPSTEGPIWNLKKMGQAVSEKKIFTDFMILYLYTSPGAMADNPMGWVGGWGGGQGGEEVFFMCFYHIWAWQPFWLTDHVHLNKFSIPL